MDLDAQIQVLVDDAPQDGITPQVIAAIAPGLKLIAQKLRHPQYYVLQSMDSEWLMTTLSNRTNPDIEKYVIYAFPTLKDIPTISSTELEADLIAVPLPVTHILFQLTALKTVDSIIFFELSGDSTNGVEIRREDVENLIQQLKQKPAVPSNSPNQLPPDIA